MDESEVAKAADEPRHMREQEGMPGDIGLFLGEK
jgi:hypothetical protein